jgi:hypothetical protein
MVLHRAANHPLIRFEEAAMSHDDAIEDRGSITRRDFTLQSVLALLSGCVITISDACGKDNSPTPPTPTTTPTDINGVVSANHGHVAVVTGAQITAGNTVTLNIQGMATHNHTITFAATDLTTLKNRQPVSVTSTTDNGHLHTVTFTPA